jgi:hypothetical protein
MKKGINRVLLAIVVSSLMVWAFLASSSLAQQAAPKPGDVIDHNNYKNYQQFFPPEWLQGFEDGFAGMTKPFSIKVAETVPAPFPKRVLEATERNRGKASLDKDGNLVGYSGDGLPFADLDKNDKEFFQKLMWNFTFRYQFDTCRLRATTYAKRRGEVGTTILIDMLEESFATRFYDTPKPMLPNPVGLYIAHTMHFIDPLAFKDTVLLMYRFLDTKKPDETFVYLPTMRRVLRGDAGQRSTPVSGSIAAPDDFNGFEGRIPDFKYQYVGEQQVLGVNNSTLSVADARAQKVDVPLDSTGWEVRNCWVIDIIPKDPKYPQGKKRIYMDKENLNIYYAVAWDRAGKVWKIFTQNFEKIPATDGEYLYGNVRYIFQIDVQFGIINIVVSDNKVNGIPIDFQNFTPEALLKMVK